MQHSANAALQSADRPPRRLGHLGAAAIALCLVVALTLAADAWCGAYSARFLDRLAPTGEDEVIKGVYLTQMAINQPDRLVLLGSSELTFQDEYHAVKLFAGKPTGFSTFVVGSGYRQSIHNFLTISALGPSLKGKKVALFISPTWFTKKISDKAYKKNYSPLQAYEFAFHANFSPALKQEGAARLLSLGSPATDDPLLRGALSGLARGGLWGKAQYYVTWPLGQLSLAHLRFKDRTDILQLTVRKHLQPTHPAAARGAINWSRLEVKAMSEAKAKSTSNRFGMLDDFYARQVAPRLAELEGTACNETWLDSTEYDDLALVLRTLKEVQAEPLFISLPVLGPYQDFRGHPAADRKAYYARVHQMIEQAGFPLVDLGDCEYEPGFHRDPWHQGWKGSVKVAEALDRFYHDGQ